jgi:hypothetical protein
VPEKSSGVRLTLKIQGKKLNDVFKDILFVSLIFLAFISSKKRCMHRSVFILKNFMKNVTKSVVFSVEHSYIFSREKFQVRLAQTHNLRQHRPALNTNTWLKIVLVGKKFGNVASRVIGSERVQADHGGSINNTFMMADHGGSINNTFMGKSWRYQ